MIFMPDSPVYLISKQKPEEARKALQWLRGSSYNPDAELKEMQWSNEEEQKVGRISLSELFSNRLYWQPFLIAMFGMFGQQFCGINAVIFYLETIFIQSGSSIAPSITNVLIWPYIHMYFIFCCC
jgi:facilitated trehalose transporter